MSTVNKFNPELFHYDSSKSYQWLAFPKTTLGIVTWNRREYTKMLLTSLVRYTHLPHEIFIVDNGSDEDTVEYVNRGVKRGQIAV